MQGIYWIDGAGILHVARQDSKGKNYDFGVPISVENAELPMQICFAETTEGIACTAFSFGRRMSKFFLRKMSEDGSPAVPEIDASRHALVALCQS
jgi:hypothetical protein